MEAIRRLALIAVVVGAAGSVALMLRVGQRAPAFLLFLFAGWVLSPFVALAFAHGASRRWSVVEGRMLTCVMLIVSLASLANLQEQRSRAGCPPKAAVQMTRTGD